MSDIMMKAVQLQAESMTRQVGALAAENKLLTAENAGVRQLLTDFAERHAADETRIAALEAENARAEAALKEAVDILDLGVELVNQDDLTDAAGWDAFDAQARAILARAAEREGGEHE